MGERVHSAVFQRHPEHARDTRSPQEKSILGVSSDMAGGTRCLDVRTRCQEMMVCSVMT